MMHMLCWTTINAIYYMSSNASAPNDSRICVTPGSQLVIFDPHCNYLPNITPQNPGKRINFVESSAADAHPDQFTPYQAFGCDARSYFNGTLFRFPLRTAEQAACSRISKQVLSFHLGILVN